MSNDHGVDISLFLGDPLQEPSEIQFLDKLYADLTERGRNAIIFANFFAGRLKQQTDFLIITSKCACVVELKNYNLPVFGQVNGAWELKRHDGTLSKRLGERNPYHQALQAKYSISDEMHLLQNDHPELPAPPNNKKYYQTLESVVCLFPDIPAGSQLTPGDYKTYVKGYPDFLQFLLSSTTNPGWSKDNWLKLAMKLGLRCEQLSDTAQPDRHLAIEQCEEYIRRFLDYYGNNLTELVPTEMTADGNLCEMKSLLGFLDRGTNFQVIGPSGSGKTHLIKHFAIQSISHGFAPIFVQAKYFTGRLSDLLDRSVAHLHPGKIIHLLKSFPIAGRRPYLIIDGVNECPSQQLSSLIETLQALILRKKYIIIMTTQTEIKLPPELKGSIVRLKYLTNLEKKEGILHSYLPEYEADIVEVLDALKTPFEISLAADCAIELGGNFTKYELFNYYTRKSLGNEKSVSIAFRILVKIAEILAHRLSTAMPISEFMRIAESTIETFDYKIDTVESILKSKIVEVTQGYFAFSHEMIQRFFEAEALLSSCESAEALASEMEKPRNYDLAEFVLGAMSNSKDAKRLLRLSAFYRLLYECIFGRYGSHAKAAINSEVIDLYKKAHEQLKKIDLVFTPGKGPFWRNLQIVCSNWSEYEVALMGAIGEAFSDGFFIKQTLRLFIKTERTCFKLLETKGFPENLKTNLRNELFANLYVWVSPNSLPVSKIFQTLRFKLIKNVAPELLNITKRFLIDLDKQPLGILALICELTKYETSLIAELPRLLRRCWGTGIYHLRLQALDAARDATFHNMDTALRDKIIEVIQSLDWEKNILLSTAILEVLSAYGAIETGITVDDAMEEIHRVLRPPANMEKEIHISEDMSMEAFLNQSAYNIFSKIFEDIYQGVYYEAIEKLNTDDLLRFLVMAGLGAPSESMSVSDILRRLLEFNDSRTLPVFERWATIPKSNCVAIQDTVESFLLAIIGMARFRGSPPILRGPRRDDEAAWDTYREILYWLHKPSIGEETVRRNCEPCWERLLQRFCRAAIDPLMRIQDAIHSEIRIARDLCKDLMTFFPLEIRDLLEAGLEVRSELTSLFGDHSWFKKDHVKFMIESLEEIGSEASIPVLEKLIEDPNVGRIAAKAIRTIRGRIII